MNDFLSFRKMITPVIIQVIFWIGVVATFIAGIVMMATSSGDAGQIIGGLLLMLFGWLLVRIYCELLILFFRMFEVLQDIKSDLERR